MFKKTSLSCPGNLFHGGSWHKVSGAHIKIMAKPQPCPIHLVLVDIFHFFLVTFCNRLQQWYIPSSDQRCTPAKTIVTNGCPPTKPSQKTLKSAPPPIQSAWSLHVWPLLRRIYSRLRSVIFTTLPWIRNNEEHF